MTRRLLRLILPLTALAVSLAVPVFGYAAQGRKVSAPQKRRVAARGHLTGTHEIQQVVIWQTSNPPGGTLPYAKAHLAVEPVGADRRAIWQTDGGESQYLVDSIQLKDLDGDGVPEIISLWWEGASAGGALRIFHWDRAKQTFVELRSHDMSGAHSYQIRRGGNGASNRIILYIRPAAGAGRRPVSVQYEMRGEELIQVGGGGVVMAQGESGIEGQVFISPIRPGPIRLGQTNKAPYETTLAIMTAGQSREVTRLKTGSDGRFRVTLPPGEYEIVPAPDKGGRFLPRASAQQVKVLPGQFAQVTIDFDSGMR